MTTVLPTDEDWERGYNSQASPELREWIQRRDPANPQDGADPRVVQSVVLARPTASQIGQLWLYPPDGDPWIPVPLTQLRYSNTRRVSVLAVDPAQGRLLIAVQRHPRDQHGSNRDEMQTLVGITAPEVTAMISKPTVNTGPPLKVQALRELRGRLKALEALIGLPDGAPLPPSVPPSGTLLALEARLHAAEQAMSLTRDQPMPSPGSRTGSGNDAMLIARLAAAEAAMGLTRGDAIPEPGSRPAVTHELSTVLARLAATEAAMGLARGDPVPAAGTRLAPTTPPGPGNPGPGLPPLPNVLPPDDATFRNAVVLNTFDNHGIVVESVLTLRAKMLVGANTSAEIRFRVRRARSPGSDFVSWSVGNSQFWATHGGTPVSFQINDPVRDLLRLINNAQRSFEFSDGNLS